MQKFLPWQPKPPLKNPPQQAMGFIQQSFYSGLRLNSTLLKASPKLLKCLREQRQPTAIEVRQLFEALGVTYIKLGQFIASSPTLFPNDYVEAFQNCLDRAPEVPFKVIHKIIEQELGHTSEQSFRYIEKIPLASASIAQVHGAVMHNGDKVVIKVQKPGVENIIDTDLNAAFFISRIIELVSPALDRRAITDIITEIHRSMRDECDFIKEANNLVAFNHFLHQQNITTVIAPKVYADASSKRMLTMERINGKSFTDPSLSEPSPVSPSAINLSNTASASQTSQSLSHIDAKNALFEALSVWFLSLQHCDFFHADLHSGNLLLTDSGQVAFIDFGMIGKITPAIWSAAVQLVQSFGSEDFQSMSTAMIAIGMTNSKVDAKQLERDLQAVFVESTAPPSATKTNSNAKTSKDNSPNDEHQNPLALISQIARRHGIRFPSAFTLLLKQFLYFDRYLQLLAPDTGLFDQDHFQTIDEAYFTESLFDR